MNRKLLIAELYVLSILGKNHKKDSLIKRSGLFKSYGGGVLASQLDSFVS